MLSKTVYLHTWFFSFLARQLLLVVFAEHTAVNRENLAIVADFLLCVHIFMCWVFFFCSFRRWHWQNLSAFWARCPVCRLCCVSLGQILISIIADWVLNQIPTRPFWLQNKNKNQYIVVSKFACLVQNFEWSRMIQIILAYSNILKFWMIQNDPDHSGIQQYTKN